MLLSLLSSLLMLVLATCAILPLQEGEILSETVESR